MRIDVAGRRLDLIQSVQTVRDRRYDSFEADDDANNIENEATLESEVSRSEAYDGYSDDTSDEISSKDGVSTVSLESLDDSKREASLPRDGMNA